MGWQMDVKMLRMRNIVVVLYVSCVCGLVHSSYSTAVGSNACIVRTRSVAVHVKRKNCVKENDNVSVYGEKFDK